MSRRNGMFGPSLMIPAVVVFGLLIAVALFTSSDDFSADATEFYDINDLSVTMDLGSTVLGNGSYVSPGNLINITVTGGTTPTGSDDVMVIDLNLTDGDGKVAFNTTFSLDYSGTNDDFWGNLSLSDSLTTDTEVISGGLKINVDDGYTINIKKHNEDQTWMHLEVDAEGPSIDVSGPLHLFVESWGINYATTSATLDIYYSDVDTNSTSSQAILKGWVKYKWDGGSAQTWDGTNFAVPSSIGTHILEVNASDSFENYKVYTYSYEVTETIPETPIITAVTYENKTLLSPSLEIMNGGSLDLKNCTLMTLDEGDKIVVNNGGYLNITGPEDDTANNISLISSTFEGMSIIARPDSHFFTSNTEFHDWGDSPNEATIILWEGVIESSSIFSSTTGLSIKEIGVAINDTIFHGNNTDMGILVDVDHSWSDEATTLTNLEFKGDFKIPVKIMNNSIWKPYDIDQIYYIAEGNTSLVFETPSAEDGYSDPYLYFPHYLDSRSQQSVLEISYYNSTGWEHIPGSSISDIVFNNWINGEEAKIDLSSIPQGTSVKLTFNASNNHQGRLYIGQPYVGGSNMDPIPITANNFDGIVDQWLSQPVDDYSLLMENVSMDNASMRFMDIESSGLIWINGLYTGTGLENPEIETQIEIDHASAFINGSELKGNNQLNDFIKITMEGENDYPTTTIMDTEMSSWGQLSKFGILSDMAIVDLRNLTIYNVTIGLNGDGTIITTDVVDIHPTSYGISLELPDTLEEDLELDLEGITVSGPFQYGGVHVEGDVTYGLDITFSKLDIGSTFDDSTFDRNDGYGGLSLDLVSTMSAEIHIDGKIEEGPWHGIAVNNWPSDGRIQLLAESSTNSMDLDGIWLDDDVLLEIDEGVNINYNRGWGIYGYEGSDIKLNGLSDFHVNIQDNSLGGIYIADESTLNISLADLFSNGGHAIYIEEGVSANLTDMVAIGNNFGVKALSGTDLIILSSEIKNTRTGDGLYLEEVDAAIKGRTKEDRTIISGNNKRGIFAADGSLHIEFTTVEENKMDGIYLWGVDVTSYDHVISSGNGGDGLLAHVDDNGLLGAGDVYFHVLISKFHDNTGKGMTITFDPTSVPGGLTMDLEGVKVYNNSGGDIISSPEVLYIWTMVGSDELGTSDHRGQTVANLQISIPTDQIGLITNEEIYFLNDDTTIIVEELGTIIIDDSTIRPLKNTDRWSIEAAVGSKVTVTGSYFAFMDLFSLDGSSTIRIEETHLINSEEGLKIEDSSFLIESCQFTGISGNSIDLMNSTGTISNSGISGSTMGILVNGLDGTLNIRGTTFVDNSWGLYIFDAENTSTIKVTDSVFLEGENEIAPIWTKADIILEDSDLNPDDIIVESNDASVSLFYTLTIHVLDEEDEEQVFDINLKVGDSPSSIIKTDNPGTWSQMLRSYYVTRNSVDRSRESLRFTISYSDTPDTQVHQGYIIDSLILNARTTMTYYGYEKPWLTEEGKEQSILYAIEDKGLENGPTDISGWFTDAGTDDGNLTYSVESLTDEIEVNLIGSILSLNSDENWNGYGKIQITVTDPHGKELIVVINVDVRPENDLPWITDARIEAIGGVDNIPRSNGNIRAAWTWNDIDEGDRETEIWIEWYLNGTIFEEFTNKTIVTGVKAGQIWNFKIWPSDQDTQFTQIFGDPVVSQPVVVQSVGPRWTSDLTVNTNSPTSNMDIIVSPGTFDDPDSSLVTFNYMWEMKKGNMYTPIGAPNSPILDSRFTSKNQEIRVRVWLSDGITSSGVKTALFKVRNSAPQIVSASISPKLVREDDDIITIGDFVTYDADGDPVTLYYEWRVGDISVPGNEIPYLTKTQGSWSYPGRANITVIISCYDTDNQEGTPLTLSTTFLPTDTDDDGLFDDVNGDGDNDPGDDPDDDGDGFPDIWEIYLGTDPLNPLSTPLDTDGDGIPDGDPENTQTWMDIDDDEDNIEDSEDSYPRNGALPGDFDKDGIGDDKDNDIDGDNVLNKDDYDPYNPNVTDPPEEPGQSLIEIFIFILLILIIIAIGAGIYAVATGMVNLPSNAPPGIEAEEGAEAIFDEDDDGKPSKKDELEELEDVDNMSVCSVCGELISLDEENCPNCGAVFDDMDEEDLDFDDEDDDD